MSDEMMKPGHTGHETEFEHEDLSTRGIIAFMIGLAVSGIVIYFIIVGMYTFLDDYERSQMSTARFRTACPPQSSAGTNYRTAAPLCAKRISRWVNRISKNFAPSARRRRSA